MQEKIELNEQLARYSITAGGQIAQGRNLGAYPIFNNLPSIPVKFRL